MWLLSQAYINDNLSKAVSVVVIPDKVRLSPSLSAKTSVELVILALGAVLMTLTLMLVESVAPLSSVTVAVIHLTPVVGHDAVISRPFISQSLSVKPSPSSSANESKSQHTTNDSTSEAVSSTSAVKVILLSSKIGCVEPRLAIDGATFVMLTIPLRTSDFTLSLSYATTVRV